MADLRTFYAARERFGRLRRELAEPFAWSPDGRSVEWTRDGAARRFELPGAGPGGNRAAMPAKAGDVRYFNRETYLVPEWPMPEAPSPDGRWFASLRDRELYLRAAEDGTDRILTSGATEDTGWDLETVNVDPWSPDGRWLYACAVDRSQVVRSVRTRFGADGAVGVDQPRTQRAGTPIDVIRPHLVPVDDGASVPIELGDTRDRIVRLAGWLPDGRGVLIASFTRLLDRVDLFEAEAAGGRARLVLSETSATFLRQATIVWTEPVGCWPLPNGRFLWLSPRDGWTHLYVGELANGTLRKLTHGPMVVYGVVRWDEEHVWFHASLDGERPYDRHLFRIPLAGGASQRLTDDDGDHEVCFSPDGLHFVDSRSTPRDPPRTRLRSADGALLAELEAFDAAPLLGAAWRPPEEVTLLAADGDTPLYGLLYLPAGFDPAHRYPLVHWLYGGPQVVAAPHRFGPRDDNQVLHQALAAVGYAVFVIDGRGTPGRSKAFADVVWRSFSAHVVADQTGALRQLLEARPWLDQRRIGVMGRSWGAHFALRLLAAAPDLYRAAALVVPGLDPYGGLIYEPYLGLPQDDPEPYRAAEPWDVVRDIAPDARLLLMAGTLDSPCQWDLQRLSTLLVEADVAHHALTFAEQEHVFEGAAQRFHDRAIHDFFADALA